MFCPDVLEYKHFYGTRPGTLVRRLIRRHLRQRWAEVGEQETVMGLGFALPYLALYEGRCRTIACMPGAQGVIHWPAESANRACLADEAELPFASNSIERIIVIHTLEHTHHPLPMLEELWRVLVPGGRLMLYTPNRRGIWARLDNTPLGHGRPYSPPQLKHLLKESKFTLAADGSALFCPPTENGFLNKYAYLWEGIGRRFFFGFGGLLWLEAEKQVYAMHKPSAQKVRKRAIYVPAGAIPSGFTKP